MDKIQDIILGALALYIRLEKKIYNEIINHFIDNFDIKDNVIGLTNHNIKVVAGIDKINVSKSVKKTFDYSNRNINDLIDGADDLVEVDVRKIETTKSLKNELKKHSATTLATQYEMEIIYSDLKRHSLNLLTRPDGISLRDLRKSLEKKIVKDGLVRKYWSRWTHDIYYQYQRTAAYRIAKEIGLEDAIYEGGLIDDSRLFCKERNSEVFNIEEIESWKDLEWKGKPEIGYNPISDCGGYNCRHRLIWISKETAKRLKK